MRRIIALLKAIWAFIKELFKNKKQRKIEFIEESIQIFATLMDSSGLDGATGFIITQIRKTDDREGVVIIAKEQNKIDHGVVVYIKAIVDGGIKTTEKFPFCIPLVFPFVGDPMVELQKRSMKLAEDLNIKQSEMEALQPLELEHSGDGGKTWDQAH